MQGGNGAPEIGRRFQAVERRFGGAWAPERRRGSGPQVRHCIRSVRLAGVRLITNRNISSRGGPASRKLQRAISRPEPTSVSSCARYLARGNLAERPRR